MGAMQSGVGRVLWMGAFRARNTLSADDYGVIA